MSERPKVRRPRRVDAPLEREQERHSKDEGQATAPKIAASNVSGDISPVTADTPMRSIGDLPASTWRSELARLDSPMLPEVEEIVRAASPHGALALTQAARESSYGTAANARQNFNAWGLMVRGSNPSRLQRFGSWAEAAAEFSRRLSDHNPPYDPENISVRDYLLTYVGGPLCRSSGGRTCANGETLASITRYTDAMLADLNRLRAAGDGGSAPAPDAPIVFGRVPHPPFEDRIVGNSRAWNDLGPRQIVGTCRHSMIGTLRGTDNYFRGAAAGTALTDYGIGGATDGALDGVIYRWNDPLGRRAPWANGPANHLEGDGPAFVRRYGVSAVNRDLVSIERSDGGNTGTPVSPAQMASLVALIAHWHDRARVPWGAFPVNPAGGVVTAMEHWEFGPKECPFPPVRSRVSEINERVRSLMRQYQTGQTGPAPQIPAPVPDGGWPEGMDAALAAGLFGTLVRTLEDGSTREYGFDGSGKGVISAAWLARGRADREWPEAQTWETRPAFEVVTFANGWVLAKDRNNEKQSWFWV